MTITDLWIDFPVTGGSAVAAGSAKNRREIKICEQGGVDLVFLLVLVLQEPEVAEAGAEAGGRRG